MVRVLKLFVIYLTNQNPPNITLNNKENYQIHTFERLLQYKWTILPHTAFLKSGYISERLLDTYIQYSI